MAIGLDVSAAVSLEQVVRFREVEQSAVPILGTTGVSRLNASGHVALLLSQPHQVALQKRASGRERTHQARRLRASCSSICGLVCFMDRCHATAIRRWSPHPQTRSSNSAPPRLFRFSRSSHVLPANKCRTNASASRKVTLAPVSPHCREKPDHPIAWPWGAQHHTVVGHRAVPGAPGTSHPCSHWSSVSLSRMADVSSTDRTRR